MSEEKDIRIEILSEKHVDEVNNTCTYVFRTHHQRNS